jgi:tripartite-type tricarboxylate transporter receptor subunit TctC
MSGIIALAFGVAGLLGAMTPTAVSADAVSDFYKKKRIRIIQSSAPGGGYDMYARTLARHFPKHIPGNPRILVQNKPGAGGIVAANYIYNVAPQDGTIIAGLQRGAPMAQIMGQKGPMYDPEKFFWLGSVTNEAGVLAVLKSSKVNKLEDVFTKTAILGSTGSSDTQFYPALMNNVLGARFQLVDGYPSATLVHLAMRRNEVEGISQSWSSFKIGNSKELKAGKISVLAQLSLKPHPELTKMGVPLIFDVIDKQHVLPGFTVKKANNLFRLMLTSKAMGRPYALGPKVPADRVKAMRSAFMATVRDPAFIKDAHAQGRDVSPISGQEVQQMIATLTQTPKATIKEVEGLIVFKGKVRKVKIALAKHTGKVTATKKGGRRIFISYKGKNVKAKVSGSRTKVTIDGKKAKRKAIKVGMTCTFTYPGAGQEAKRVDCKG